MYLPSDEACNAPNGSQVPTADLAAAAAGTAADASSMNAALSAFNSTLTRAPADFFSVAPMVAKDVSIVNARTGVDRGGQLPGGSVDGGGSCDVSASGGCDVTPLNGPGVTSLPQANAQPAPLRTAPISPGLGRVRDVRRRFPRSRGMGQACCTDLPAWGDAFPNGGPVASPVQSLLDWAAANPLLTLGLAVTGLWIANSRGKRG